MSRSPVIAVIQFPGSNCEYETQRALCHVGLDARIVRWNDDVSAFSDVQGYVLPGGFSYQDRVRAGAIAAKLPIIDVLLQADADEKPILGICNGCQILSETGIVPNVGGGRELEIALTPNQRDDRAMGFICDWVFVRPSFLEQNIFTSGMSADAAIPIPINHGEGRFVWSPGISIDDLEIASLYYCDANGQTSDAYPITPNGSTGGLAGIGNRKGNAFAMMPHPERATFLKQVPAWIDSPWADQKMHENGQVDGPWIGLFQSLAEALK